MRPLRVTVGSDPGMTRLLATWGPDDCLRAVLPTRPIDPRAPFELLEALASWLGTPARAAIVVDAQAPGWCAEHPFGGRGLPEDTARLLFSEVVDQEPLRIRGLGSFRGLYRLHGGGR